MLWGAVFAFVQCQMAVSINLMCRNRSAEETAFALRALPHIPNFFDGPNFLQGARINLACDKYLQCYLIALGGGRHLATAAAIEKEADSLIFDSEFALVMDKLNQRSNFCEFVLSLPYLAETYQRCAVAQCRRRATASSISAPATTTESVNPAARAYSYRLLATQTRALANLFCRRRKYEIAERAFQDAIISATTGSAGDSIIFRPYYYSYVAFLYEHRREDDALLILEKLQAFD